MCSGSTQSVLLDQRHARSPLDRCAGGSRAGRSTSDHNDVVRVPGRHPSLSTGRSIPPRETTQGLFDPVLDIPLGRRRPSQTPDTPLHVLQVLSQSQDIYPQFRLLGHARCRALTSTERAPSPLTLLHIRSSPDDYHPGIRFHLLGARMPIRYASTNRPVPATIDAYIHARSGWAYMPK